MMEGREICGRGLQRFKKHRFRFRFLWRWNFHSSGRQLVHFPLFFCTVYNAASSIRAVVCCLSVHRHAACVLHKCAALLLQNFPSLALTSKWMLSSTVVFCMQDRVLYFDLVDKQMDRYPRLSLSYLLGRINYSICFLRNRLIGPTEWLCYQLCRITS